MEKSAWIGLKLKKEMEFLAPTDIEYTPINDPALLHAVTDALRTTLLLKETGDDRIIQLLTDIKEQVIELNKGIGNLKSVEEKVIVFKELSKKEAKEEIKKYFAEHKDSLISYSELVDNLKIDLKSIVEICSELEKEGLIG